MQAPLEGVEERMFLESLDVDTCAVDDDSEDDGEDGEQGRVDYKTVSAATMAQVCFHYDGRCCGYSVAGAFLFLRLAVDVECALSRLHRDLYKQDVLTKTG